MQKKFSLFHKSDVNSTVMFFRKRLSSIEEDIKWVELYHSKELERDLMIEKITKLIVNIVMSKEVELIKRKQKNGFKFYGTELLGGYFSKVAKASGWLLRILGGSIKGNTQMIFWLMRIEQKILAMKESAGKSTGGMENILAVSQKQIEWRKKVTEFLKNIESCVAKIKEIAKPKAGSDWRVEAQTDRYEQILELQRNLYNIIKEELGIEDANVNLENLEEHEDKVCQYIEQYYFNRQRTTTDIDTKLAKRRKRIKQLEELLMNMSKHFRLDMFPITSAVIHYPKLLFFKDSKLSHGISELAKQNQERIRKSAVRIPTKKGYSLQGTYFEKEGCNKVIVMLHGVTGGGFELLITALEYSRHYNILIYTSTGHFGSGGHGGLGIEEARDFREVLDWLIDVKGNLAIGVYGVSLGGSAAIGGIAMYSRQDYIKAAVFQAAFADRDQTLDEYYVDIFKMPDCPLRKFLKYALDFNLKRHDSNYKPKELIKEIRCPIFLIHDIEDPMIRFHNAQDLARNVKAPLKTYFKHGSEHYSPTNKVKVYLVFQFLRKYLGD